jgi:hypothetical protein
MDDDTTLLGTALYYATLGVKVFPVGTSTGRKVPLTRHGFKDASNEQDKVLAMWRNGATMIGAVHDFASIVDIDGDEGEESFKRIEHRLPKPTAVVRTRSGGRHLYFPNPKNTDLKRKIRILPGLDLLAGDGGYTILPGSAGYELVSGSIESLLESK